MSSRTRCLSLFGVHDCFFWWNACVLNLRDGQRFHFSGTERKKSFVNNNPRNNLSQVWNSGYHVYTTISRIADLRLPTVHWPVLSDINYGCLT